GNPMAILLDGSTGRLTIADPENPTTGDFLRMDRGKLETYFYAGDGYHMVKNLRRMETGVAENNTVVELPGYWPSIPKVFVTPRTIQTYSKDYPSQSQSVDYAATNITWDPTTKVATFKPLARLVLSAGRDVYLPGLTVNYAYSDGAGSLPYAVETGEYTIPANVETITVKAACYAQKFIGGGPTHATYEGLTVIVRAVVSGTGGGTFIIGAAGIPDKEVNLRYYPAGETSLVQGNVNFPASASPRTVKIRFTVASDGYPYSISPSVGYSWPIDEQTAFWGRFVEVSYANTGASIISEGYLNYIAIGE
ncbi:hypothetical protein EOM39_08005, partial [Candidatus Gracilibacteria bacterium]|nr:hypothetical protein [Candidatus Gracilibacteria bacterium]